MQLQHSHTGGAPNAPNRIFAAVLAMLHAFRIPSARTINDGGVGRHRLAGGAALLLQVLLEPLDIPQPLLQQALLKRQLGGFQRHAGCMPAPPGGWAGLLTSRRLQAGRERSGVEAREEWRRQAAAPPCRPCALQPAASAPRLTSCMPVKRERGLRGPGPPQQEARGGPGA